MSPVIFVTVTDFTTVPAPTSFATIGSSMASVISSKQSSLLTSLTTSVTTIRPTTSPIQSTVSSAVSSFVTSISSSQASNAPGTITTLSPSINTGKPTPPALPKEEGPSAKNNTLANIVLATIILLVVLYLAAIILGCVYCYKGRCLNCKESKDRLKQLEKGMTDRVTVDMIHGRRGSILSQSDVGSPTEVVENRGAALADLEQNSGQDTFQTLSPPRNTYWPGLLNRMSWKGKERVATPGPESGLGYGTRSPLPSVHPPFHPPVQPDRDRSPIPSRFSEETHFRDNRGNIVSQFVPYMEFDTRPQPGQGTNGTDAERATRQTLSPDAGPSRETLIGPYLIERVPDDDPDAQAYRNAAQAAADTDNPDRGDYAKFATRLLENIRKREAERQQDLNGALPDPSQFEFQYKAGASESKWGKAKNLFGVK